MQRMLTAAAIMALVTASGAGVTLAQTSTTPVTPPASSTMAPTAPGTASTNFPAATQSPTAGMPSAQAVDPRSPSTIKQAQQVLQSQGLYQGPIDGVMGPETHTALSHFQRSNGLTQSAELDSATMQRLLGNESPGTSPAMRPPVTGAAPSNMATPPGTSSTGSMPGGVNR